MSPASPARPSFQPVDPTDPGDLQAFAGVIADVWPEFAQTVDELLHEITAGGAAERWLVTLPGESRPRGAVATERIRWNDDGAPPLTYALLPDGHRAADDYAELLVRGARFAVAEGFDELRVLAWDRDVELTALLTGLDGWREVGREVDVGLDLSRDIALAEVPDGVEVTTLAARPDLARGAHDCLVSAVGDIPGDETEVVPAFDAWLAEQHAPNMRPEAIFLALDGATGEVLGYGALEFLALQPELAWNGYTAVRPSARGRGIAQALKAASIGWARVNGFEQLRTENEARNAPMRHINAQLGYQPVAYRVSLRGPVAAVLALADDAGAA